MTDSEKEVIMEEEESIPIMEAFHKLEKECLGYENFVNCEDKNYCETLEKLRRLVVRIQKEHLFSDNEQIKEIETDHLRLLTVPYYEADTLYRIMDNRSERVKLSQTFYLEYLKLMNHYEMLDQEQRQRWKAMAKESYHGEEEEEGDGKKQQVAMYGPINFDHFNNRNDKIAMFKRKKDIET